MAVFSIIPAIAQSESLGKFATNGLGSYVLEKPWIGEERQTVATGFYATNREATEIQAVGKQLRLDLLNVRRAPFSTNQTNWTLGQKLELTDRGWSYGKPHTYRQHLPTDPEIKANITVSNINELLGQWDYADGAPYNAHWSLFTFGPSNTVETLTVSCMSMNDDVIDSLKVKRGVLVNNGSGDKPR